MSTIEGYFNIIKEVGTLGVLGYIVVYVNKSLTELNSNIARLATLVEGCNHRGVS